MSTDIQTTGSQRDTMREMQVREGGVKLTNYEQMWIFSKTAAASGLVPNGFAGKPEKVLIAVQMGAELGLPPMTALRSIAVINGRPSLWGDGLLAIVRSSKRFRDIDEIVEGEGDAMVATCKVWRTDREEPIVRTFSVKDAKTAQLWAKAGPWQQYPRRMLQLRARGFALRDAFPDALGGFMLAEEAQDLEADGNDGHASRSDAMLAALQQSKVPEPEDVAWREAAPGESQEPEASTSEPQDLPPEPDEEEAEAIRRADMAEAAQDGRLFNGGDE